MRPAAGYGVNDAPALSQAGVWIAMAPGSDVAAGTAGVVLMRSDPAEVPTALSIGRATLRKCGRTWAGPARSGTGGATDSRG